MANNEPPKLTTVVQDARRKGYPKMDYAGAKAHLENLKNKKNEGDAPNYGTMKNKKDGGGTNYFSMNYMANKNNAQDANTESTFKNPIAVRMAGGTDGLNDGHMNYGTPVNHDTGEEHKHESQYVNKKKFGKKGFISGRDSYGGGTNTDLLDVGRNVYNKAKAAIKNLID